MSYHFSEDWFTAAIPNWRVWTAPLRGLPCRCLEIGSYQGRSTVWMLENVLTHPDARITCIDTFEGSVENTANHKKDMMKIFLENVSAFDPKVELQRGKSGDVLRQMSRRRHFYDFVYIDGCHFSANVMEDDVLTFPLVKIGGMIVFDDYGGGGDMMNTPHQPKTGIDGFVAAYAPYIEVVHTGYQMALRKRADLL
jgi:predicted O-methyltransferase YrrM